MAEYGSVEDEKDMSYDQGLADGFKDGYNEAVRDAIVKIHVFATDYLKTRLFKELIEDLRKLFKKGG